MHTVKQAIAHYSTVRLPELATRTATDYVRNFVVIEDAFGSRELNSISRSELSEFLKVPKGKIQRNKAMAVLSAVYTEAMKWGWAESNPCYRFERNEIQRKPRKELTEAEFQNAKKKIEGWGRAAGAGARAALVMDVGSSRVDLQACKLEYSIVSPK